MPIFLIKVHASILHNLWVINPCFEINLWYFPWIFIGKIQFNEENSSSVKRVLWSHHYYLPFQNIWLVNRPSLPVGWWVLIDIFKLFLNSYDTTTISLTILFLGLFCDLTTIFPLTLLFLRLFCDLLYNLSSENITYLFKLY